MELLNILKNGNFIEPGRQVGDTTADVSITRIKNAQKEKYCIRFKNGTGDKLGEKVTPIVIQNRVYFARPEQVGKKGYKLSIQSGNNTNTRFAVVTTNALANYVGEYEELKVDSESKLCYVERKRLG